MEKDFEYLKQNDPYFNFSSVEEWVEWLKEASIEYEVYDGQS